MEIGEAMRAVIADQSTKTFLVRSSGDNQVKVVTAQHCMSSKGCNDGRSEDEGVVTTYAC